MSSLWQGCQRAADDPGRPLAVAGVEAMGALVYAMTQDWERQAHAATVAALSVPPPVPPPRVPEGAPLASAPPPGSAAAAGAEAVAGAAAAAGLAESAAAQAANGPGAKAGDIGEVIDLVPGLGDKRL